MADITVRFLGSGDAFGSGGRLPTCIHVSTPTTQFLVDCGPAALPMMRRYDINPTDIDSILLSHLHGDHFGGLPFIIREAQLVSRRTRPLIVVGPPGVAARVRTATEAFFPGGPQVHHHFSPEFIEWSAATPTTIGPLIVTPQEVLHPSGATAYALRIAHGASVLAYSGDTIWVDTLRRVADDADLFICEAYTYEKRINYHLDYRTLRAERATLGCRRLILTHMSADMLAHLAEIDTESAEDGLLLTL